MVYISQDLQWIIVREIRSKITVTPCCSKYQLDSSWWLLLSTCNVTDQSVRWILLWSVWLSRERPTVAWIRGRGYCYVPPVLSKDQKISICEKSSILKCFSVWLVLRQNSRCYDDHDILFLYWLLQKAAIVSSEGLISQITGFHSRRKMRSRKLRAGELWLDRRWASEGMLALFGTYSYQNRWFSSRWVFSAFYGLSPIEKNLP